MVEGNRIKQSEVEPMQSNVDVKQGEVVPQ